MTSPFFPERLPSLAWAALAAGHCRAEQGGQGTVAGLGLPGDFCGGLHLGQDLILSQNPGAKAGGDLHQVAHRFLVFPDYKGVAFIGMSGCGAQQPVRRNVLIVLQGQVQFRPVAGGQQHSAPDAGFPGKLRHRVGYRRFGKTEFFPQGHGCQTVIQARHDNVHDFPPFCRKGRGSGTAHGAAAKQRALFSKGEGASDGLPDPASPPKRTVSICVC